METIGYQLEFSYNTGECMNQSNHFIKLLDRILTVKFNIYASRHNNSSPTYIPNRNEHI